jgi:isoquinoline 1-oxidoreductase beta subunit
MGTLAKITRRTFLVGAVAVTGGVAFGYYKYSQPFANPLKDDLAEGEATFNPYVKIGPDNAITVIAPRAEMGQGIFTTLGALVAEELDVTLDQIRIEHGPARPPISTRRRWSTARHIRSSTRASPQRRPVRSWA